MKPYNINSICSKCGTRHLQLHLCDKCEKAYAKEMIKTTYHKKSDKMEDRFKINNVYYDAPKDIMLRTCQNCNFQWAEEPLKA